MINKIDPILTRTINTLKFNNSELDCVIYTNNYNNLRLCLKNIPKIKQLQELPFISAFGVKVNANDISNLAKINAINYITTSLKVQTQLDVSKKVINLTQSNLPHNFSVAIIDTGVYLTPDIAMPKNRIIKFVDLVNDKNSPYDDNGHGTFITNTLAGNGLISGGKFSGIDPNANVIVIKALNSDGETGAVTILKAMQWVIDNKKKYNIKVVCMSFGSLVLGNNDPLVVGAEVLWNNGITVVAAAGNSGPNAETIKSPGASSKIITVGALDDNRENNINLIKEKFSVASFSSRGPILGNYKPDVLAPGVNIKGACNYSLLKKHYDVMSGTSVATPMVAGICSLLLAKNPDLKPNAIKRILINNTFKIDNNHNSEGFGVIDCSNMVL